MREEEGAADCGVAGCMPVHPTHPSVSPKPHGFARDLGKRPLDESHPTRLFLIGTVFGPQPCSARLHRRRQGLPGALSPVNTVLPISIAQH